MNPTLRAQIIAEWRGMPEPKIRPDRAKSIGDAMGPFLKSLGLDDRLHEQQIVGAWRELVGEFLAQHSNPRRLKDGVLYVQVLQPTIHYELNRVWKPQVLKKLKARFGARILRDIRFVIG